MRGGVVGEEEMMVVLKVQTTAKRRSQDGLAAAYLIDPCRAAVGAASPSTPSLSFASPPSRALTTAPRFIPRRPPIDIVTPSSAKLVHPRRRIASSPPTRLVPQRATSCTQLATPPLHLAVSFPRLARHAAATPPQPSSGASGQP